MALTPGDSACLTGLASEIKTAILANCSTAQPGAELNGLAFAIASAVVAHIIANATVVPSLLVAPPGAVGGPVTGTGTIT